MPSNPMQKKVRNSFLLGILTMLLIAILIGAIVFFLVIQPKQKKEEEEKKQIVTVYRLKSGENVRKDDEILINMLETTEVTVDNLNTDFLVPPLPQAYRSKIDLTEGTILTQSMVYEPEEIDPSERYMEYNIMTMPTSLQIGDVVDVRVRLTNAQDFIILSQKEVKQIIGQTIGFYVTEEEILILNSAIVETYIMPGAEIYLSVYTSPFNQKEATGTYMPTNEVIALINMDPNIVQTAKEKLVALYSLAGVQDARVQINEAKNKYEEDIKTNVETGMQQQIQAARQARENYLSGLSEED